MSSSRHGYGQIIERPVPAPAVGTGTSDKLPRETLYLPFAAGPFRLDMGLVPLQSGMFELDELYPTQMVLRRDLFERNRASVFAAMPGSLQARSEVLERVADALSSAHPLWFQRDGDRLHNRLTGETWDLAAHGSHGEALDPLELAGRLVQEDLCILQRHDGGPILTAAALCFPSRWSLADKIGRGIAAIHAPVPGFAEKLAAPVGRVLTQLPAGHCVARLNWSLGDDPALYQPDDGNYRSDRNAAVTAENAGDNLFLRVERQTLSRLPESGAVLFTIRVHVYPLGAAVLSGAVAARLATAVRALPDDMQHYKSFFPFRDALLGWLDTAADEGERERK